MKLLLDSCMSGRTRKELEAAGHDARWVGDWTEDPGDAEILARARREGRVLVTLDKGFGKLVVKGAPHSGVVRLTDVTAAEQGRLCLHVLALHSEKLLAGALITASPTRIRIRLRPREPE